MTWTRLRTSSFRYNGGLLRVCSLAGLQNLVLIFVIKGLPFSELGGRNNLIANAALPNWQLFLTIVKQLSKYNPFSHRQLSQFGRTYAFYLRRWRPSGSDDQLSAQRKATEVLTSSSNRLDFAFLYNFRDTFYHFTMKRGYPVLQEATALLSFV